MQVNFYLSLLLILIIFIFLAWCFLKARKKPLTKREFGYLRWVIYLVNLLIFSLALGVIGGIFHLIISYFGGAEWLTQLMTESETGFSLTFTLDKTAYISSGIRLINAVAALGLLICMRAFMKNILNEEIFIFKNVRLARLSTLFLLLGSLIREESDTSGLVLSSKFADGEVVRSFTYSFFSLNYLLAAVLVWTLSIILEKAVAIADENEFTI